MKKAFRRNQIVVSALAIMIAVAGYLTYAGKDGAGELYPANEAAQSGDTYIAGNLTVSDQDVIQDKNSTAASTSTAQAESESQTVSSESTASTSAAQESSADVSSQAETTTAVAASEGTSESTSETASASMESTDAAVTQNEQDIQSLDQDMADVLENPGEAVLTSGLTVADFMAQVKLNREQVRGMNKDALLEVINSEVASAQEKQSAIDNMVKLTDAADKENAAESLLKTKGFTESVVSIVDGEADVVICKDSLTDAERAQVEDIVKRKTDIGIDHIVITLMETNQ
ncbi:SpoIIIAH-like protein [Clostridiales bacterium CHKCI001]|nr:SpoIIIAH-like protein [Clostridiales bacterium CHKCI001]